MNKEIAVYDNTASGREYLSYISEQAGGFACIGRDGKLYIRKIGEDIAELDIRYLKNMKWGEQFRISRVVYEDGIQSFKKGDEIQNTLWINSNNMYIVDQEQIDNLYNYYKDFKCYGLEAFTIIDPAIDIGDILLIDGRKVIYQGNLSYSGKFTIDIKSYIQSKSKEETTTRNPSQKTINRRVQSQIDQEELRITQLVQETMEHEEKITKVEQDVDGIKQNVEDVINYKREDNNVSQVQTEEATPMCPLGYNVKGNKEYHNYLFPNESLCPSESLCPNMQIL